MKHSPAKTGLTILFYTEVVSIAVVILSLFMKGNSVYPYVTRFLRIGPVIVGLFLLSRVAPPAFAALAVQALDLAVEVAGLLLQERASILSALLLSVLGPALSILVLYATLEAVKHLKGTQENEREARKILTLRIVAVGMTALTTLFSLFSTVNVDQLAMKGQPAGMIMGAVLLLLVLLGTLIVGIISNVKFMLFLKRNKNRVA